MTEDKKENMNTVSFVMAGEARFKILLELNKTTKTPSQLKELLKVQMSHVSRTLKELQEENLIECKTPFRRKSKLFTITSQGKEILKIIHNLTIS